MFVMSKVCEIKIMHMQHQQSETRIKINETDFDVNYLYNKLIKIPFVFCQEEGFEYHRIKQY